jgi:hypothetical protein
MGESNPDPETVQYQLKVDSQQCFQRILGDHYYGWQYHSRRKSKLIGGVGSFSIALVLLHRSSKNTFNA